MNFQIFSSGIARMTEALEAIWKADFETFRKVQAANAPKVKYAIGSNGTINTTTGQTGPATISGTAVFKVDIAQDRQQTFSGMTVIVETTSGAGRYHINGDNPTATWGVEIPAGGTILDIEGMDNIVNFRMTTQGGTVNFVVLLYQ